MGRHHIRRLLFIAVYDGNILGTSFRYIRAKTGYLGGIDVHDDLQHLLGHVCQPSYGRHCQIVCRSLQRKWYEYLFCSNFGLKMTDSVSVGIIRTMVAEMVPEKELQPRAFSVMPLVWSLGSILGPSFGGFFAKPAENMPGLFGNNKFLKKFPFVLPNLIASGFFLIGLAVGILFLKVSNSCYSVQLPNASIIPSGGWELTIGAGNSGNKAAQDRLWSRGWRCPRFLFQKALS